MQDAARGVAHTVRLCLQETLTFLLLTSEAAVTLTPSPRAETT